MSAVSGFDFSRFNYVIEPASGIIREQPKVKTKDLLATTIGALYQATSKEPKRPLQMGQLAQFCQALSVHVKQKIEASYSVFSRLFLIWQTRFGELGQLSRLSATFSNSLVTASRQLKGNIEALYRKSLKASDVLDLGDLLLSADPSAHQMNWYIHARERFENFSKTLLLAPLEIKTQISQLYLRLISVCLALDLNLALLHTCLLAAIDRGSLKEVDFFLDGLDMAVSDPCLSATIKARAASFVTIYRPCQAFMRMRPGYCAQSITSYIALFAAIDPRLRRGRFWQRSLDLFCVALGEVVSRKLLDDAFKAAFGRISRLMNEICEGGDWQNVFLRIFPILEYQKIILEVTRDCNHYHAAFYNYLEAYAAQKQITLEQIFIWVSDVPLSKERTKDYENLLVALLEMGQVDNTAFAMAKSWLLRQFGRYFLHNHTEVHAKEVIRQLTRLEGVNDPDSFCTDEPLYRRMVQLAVGCPGFSFLPVTRLAHYIQKANSYAIYTKKRAELPLSLAYDPAKDDLYILLKKKVPLLVRTGTYNKVTASLRLPNVSKGPHIPAEVVCQRVSKDDDQYDEGIDETKYDLTLKELDIAKAVKDKPGIWPILYQFLYETIKKYGPVQKVSMFSPLADNDLNDLKPPIDKSELWKVASSLAEGLLAMHNAGYYHGDLAAKNALAKRGESGQIESGLIDFGLSHKIGTWPPGFDYAPGFYGSIYPTPPELFGVFDFAGDYSKVEVWALGMLFHRLAFRSLLPWENYLLEFRKQAGSQTVTEAQRRHFNELVVGHSEKAYLNLCRIEKSGTLASEQRFFLLIAKMLRLDPKNRITLTRVLDELRGHTVVEENALRRDPSA